ncbi:SDR family NAD(P)-dependent oxidoreductase [Streptomyces rhizosphaericus]|uniref:SDR family NAD(P)-dependent oxidoreductase n=2 Tax=Streptomyces rhizosphaericus TaxID=114699 RepID=UPI0036333E50
MRLAPGEWPRPDNRLVAGVSSFGMGGTNCHVLLAEPLVGVPSHASAQHPEPESLPSPIPAPAPAPTSIPAPALVPVPLPLSGVSAAALRGQAMRLRSYLERSPHLTDLSFSLATTRTSFDHRAVLITGQATDAAHGLDALAEGGTVAGLVTGTARVAGKLAFAFAGQGSQRLGMGRELSAVFPVFAQALDEVCTALDAHLDRPLRDVIHGDDAELLNRTVYAQAGLFAVEVALFRLLEDFGLVPDLLIGHSLGEVSAAHVAGVLSLADAAAFVAARGRLMQAVTEPGAMVSLEATEDEVTRTLMAGGASDDDARVCVAAVNGPTATVISGDERAVLDLAVEWTRRGRRTKRLRTSHAFHSPHLDPVLDELRHIAESLTYRAPRIPLVSNVTGRRATAEELCSPEYWVRHVRRTVRFLDGVRCLEDEGVTTIVELGPDKALTTLARDCLTGPGTLVGTLRRDRPEPPALVTALAELYVSGVEVAWSPLVSGGRRIPLPTYAFQRQRYWFSAPSPETPGPETPGPESGTTPGHGVTSGSERTDTGLSGGEARDTGTRDTGLSGGGMLGMVRAHAAVVLGYESATAIGAEHTFKQLGFDSITAVELCERLGAATALPLPGTLLFDYPTPAALAEHLHRRLHGRTDERAVPATVPTPDGGDPVVIVGMGCRFPGRAHSPEDLWRIVADGEDAISGFPSDRGWDLDGLYHPDPDRPGTSYARDGGFLYDAAEFDAGFFGISPREAEAMDPQQRLLLETSWEALERAGIPAEHIKGSSTGVFIGASSVGYAADAGSAAEGYQLTGTAASVASGRVSYALGLEGPAVTVDTACSSSLVALHLAVQSLRAGECSLALAGGVTVMATPAMFVEFSRQRGLATDGRCKAFAAAADGTGWAEGVGVLVVERLSDAERLGHRVLAVVRGSAVNQDGASNGLTAPNGPSQQRVIRQALASAGLVASDVDAVEAHGTGTTLGDPIEAQALLATYGQDRDTNRPLWLGSLKSNIGHAQAAAGVAGVIKMVMAMRHGVLPRTLHVDEPSPHVDWSGGRVELLTATTPWPTNGGLRRAGVSSFGVSGTNAHVILEQAPEIAQPTGPIEEGDREAAAVAWVLSGQGEAGLRAQAERLRAFMAADPRPTPAEVGWSLASTRTTLSHRAVVVGAGHDELLRGVNAVANGTPAPGVVRGTGSSGDVVFVFPGQGSQWAGMALELLEHSPVFAERMRECADELAPFVEWSLFDVLGDEVALGRVDVVQPVLWAVMVSLAELWRSFGVVPSVVVGHSQGEIAAACVAGGLSLEDGARVVALRSRALLALSGRGGMVSVPVAADRLRGRVGLSVAAVNGPVSTVVSGSVEVLDGVLAEFPEAKRIPVDYASHSVQVEGIREGLAEALAPVRPCAGEVPFYSTVTGRLMDTIELDAEYWYRNLRETVEFQSTVEALIDQGHTVFVEASPHPVLTLGIQDTADATDTDIVVTGSLRRDDGTVQRFLTSLSELHVRGVRIDWGPLFAGVSPVELPTYAFQRERFWLGADIAESAVDTWRYQISWKPLPDMDTPALSGTWLAVVPEGDEWAMAGARALVESGTASVRTLQVSRDADRRTLAGLLTDAAGSEDIAGVVSFLAADEVPHPAHPALSRGMAHTVELLCSLTTAAVEAPLWCVTRAAVTALPADQAPSPAQAAVWGFGRVAGLERPERWGGLIDLPVHCDAHVLRRFVAVLAQAAGEDQVAVRPSAALGRRLEPAPRTGPAGTWRPHGTVLITGGTGVLGAHVARWLAQSGAEHLVLLSRRGPQAPGAAVLDDELTALGVRVTVTACDVTDRAALAGVLASVPDLTAVVHLAGTVRFGNSIDADLDEYAGVFDAKVTGALHLDALLDHSSLEAFVLFSSAAAVWGGVGQAGYAAANALLDAVAQRRRARGLPATSIGWGTWGGSLAPEDEERLSRIGLRPMRPEVAVTELRHVVGSAEPCPAIADVDWETFGPAFTAGRPSPLLSELPQLRNTSGSMAVAGDHAALRRRLTGVSAVDQARTLVDLVREHAAELLGHRGPAAIDPTVPFRQLGFDSLTAVELRTRLNAATGLRLPATLLFDHPSCRAVADLLRSELLGDRSDSLAASSATEAVPAGVVASDEPIAIVAMSCRFPGGIETPEDLWRVVSEGRDVLSDFPDDRGWDVDALYDPDPDRPGTSYVRTGGFLHDAAEFDPELFGISPREALAMDPQQRLLLESAWQVLERARMAPTSLRSSRTGVFIGGWGQGYPSASDEGYALTGAATSVMSGRIAYALGLEGPALTVDTACSSSLVALHLASEALRRGECSLALAGGVTVMATPSTFVEFSRQRGLAPDGRCKPFAGAADGTGWGEGVGMLLLERLSDAERLGHRVLAVMRGSAVNQDGVSNGLTAPNGPSQQRVIRQALASAGLVASDVDAVEAHGTGTTLGDPIEAQALLATYGQGRDADQPLWLGSLKSNISHTQAAAGVAGVIKMVMAMRHGVLPQTLHVDDPTPHVDWSAGAVELLTERTPWPETDRPRRAGVSAFGVSGTNAHVIVEQAPEAEPIEPPRTDPVTVPWVLSGASEAGLRAQVEGLRAFADDNPALDPVDVGWSLASTRALLPYRTVVVGTGLDELRRGLDAAEVVGAAEPDRGAVLVFPGQGSQWVGMALELVGSSPVFAGRLGECADALAPFVEWSLWDVLGDEVALGRVDVVQPVLWAVMVSLAELWCSFGVVPSVVVGHSQGEIAAACVAGGLSLEDGARVVALRSRALLALSGRGGMVSVPVPADRLRGRAGLSVAAVNGPVSTVVSGSVEVLDGVLAEFPEAKRIPVDYASHSSQVEEVREGLAEALAPVRPRAGEVPFYSTVTGRLMDTIALDAEYWYRNLRETVEFQSAIEGLLELGHTVFVEASPHPVLTVGIQDTADATDTDVLVTGSLRRDGGDLASFLTALARLHVRGVAVEWREAFSGLDAHVVDLPTYAFQRRRFWAASLRQTPGAAEFDHPLLGAVVPLPDSGGGLLTGVLTLAGQPWLAEHSVAGVVLFPGTGFVELVLQAGLRWGCGVVEELTLEGPLVVPERGEVEVQVSVGGVDGAGCRSVSVFSCRGGEWVRHAVGVLGVGEGVVPGGEVWPPVGAEWVGVEGVYGVLAERGYAYGPVFQGLRDAWRRGDEVFVEVEVPAEARADAARCAIHPALLDAGLHGVGLGGLISDDGRAYLPFSWSGVRLHAVGASAVRMTLTPAGPDAVSLRVTDEAGEAVLTVDSLVLRPVTEGQLAEAEIGNRDVLHRVEWVDAGACSVGSFVEWGEVAAGGAVPDCVVLAGVDVAGVLEVLRAWVVEERFEGSRLVVVTRGAVSVSGEGVEDVGGGAVWGLVRSAQSEHPGRFVLVDADVDMDVVPDVVGLGEWQVAVRGGRVWVPRLVDAGVSVGGGVVRGELGSGVALVTGGTGLLGGLVARHLVSAYGVGELVLVSRRGPDAPGVRALVGELEGLGARVRVVACDVADRGAVAELVGSIEGLRVVVHAAGAVDDGVIGSLDAGRLRGVMGAKGWGAWHLHELTRELDLSAFVLFSSAAGVLGNAGQGGYAAANGFLDALAVHRRGRGLPAVSIAWGFWEERSELTADLAEVQLSRISRSVGASISSAQGLDLFDAALAADEPMVLATPLNLPALRDQAAAGTLPSILSGLVTAPVRRAADTGRTPAGLRHQLAGVTEAERQHQVMRLVQEHVAGVLGHASVESVDTSRTFQEIGFDSLTAVELRNRISAATGIRLPATAVFDHPTPRLLAERVLAEVGGSLPTAAPIAPVSAVDDEPIVIVGMSCRFPGGVESPEDLWHLVHSATDAVSGLPTDRGWDLATLSGAQGGVGASYARDGGFLYDAAAFDAGFFGISPREATAMDPQQRLLLEAAWEVFERAGIAPDTLKGSRTGVFTGVMYHDYGSWLTDVPEDVEGYLGTGIAGSVASGRLAYTFGLEGPALTVDTACSSSLVALHLATESLRRGECSLALAGGVTVLATPQVFVEFTRQGGLASDGRCKPLPPVRMGRVGRRVSGCCCWSGCRMLSGLGIGCWRWCVVVR